MDLWEESREHVWQEQEKQYPCHAVVDRRLLSEVVVCERMEVRAACMDFGLVLWKDTAV
jgi:hypothetical protein